MSSWRQQALIESPLDTVWALIGDPNRYPEWASEILEVTGLPTVEKDAVFRQVSEDRGETEVVNFRIEEFDEAIRTIQMRCLESRFYLRAALTEASGNTFVEMETGTSEGDREAEADEENRQFFIRLAGEMLDGLSRTAGSG